ncbi:MAG: hypothetical protein HY694_08320 [Deltaproteobacteria bacterium]|nr:hypothetical protein [Deltaproteobacteria bacterium]
MMKKRPKRAVAQESSPLALAAAASGEEEQIIAETMDGKLVGVLNYDYKIGGLILNVSGNFPSWRTVDVEIKTQDGQSVTRQKLLAQERHLALLEKTQLREKDIIQITLKPRKSLSS